VTERERKSVLRSIRIREALQKTLERDAEVQGISVNALVNAILSRYADWDRFADKFGFITITKMGYATMFELIPDEQLDQMAERMGSQNSRDMTLFWFKRLGLDTFLAYLNLVARYARTFQYEVDRQGAEVTLLVQTDLGARHSRFLLHFLSEAIHAVVGAVPRTQMGRNSVTFRFRAPSVPPSPTE
jgi:hypothetical protein